VLLERDHHPVALALAEVAMQGLDVEPLVPQVSAQPGGADLGADEDDRLLGLLRLQHLGETAQLLARLDHHVGLLDRVDGELLRGDADRDRVVHVGLGEPRDGRRHGRREEQGLAAVRAHPQDLLDVLDEAEVEHLVGLVEDDVAGRGQHERLARDQVHHPADRGNHYLGAMAQPRLLLADRSAAEDRHHVHALQMLGVGAQRLGDLDAELASRGEDDGLRLLVLRIDVLEHRQAEGGGLAAPCLRLSDHVVAVEQLGDRLCLDGSRLHVAELVEGLQQAVGQA
jgi:hypothetical protein